MQNSPLSRPKCKAIIETIWVLIIKLDSPRGAPIQCLVNTEISRVVANRHQVRNARAESLHIAKLQSLRARHDAGVPGLSAISGDGVCAIATAGPNYLWVHGPHCNQTVGRAAILRG